MICEGCLRSYGLGEKRGPAVAEESLMLSPVPDRFRRRQLIDASGRGVVTLDPDSNSVGL